MGLVVRSFVPFDLEPMALAFQGWPKDRQLFVRYADRVEIGEIDMVVAEFNTLVVGFVNLIWVSSYPPFAAASIPELSDFAVLPYARRQGVGAVLLDEAERRVGERAASVGLGVGLYADYGAAHRMYVKRGYLPTGEGLVVGAAPVVYGQMVRLDDDLELKFTKVLRTPSARP